MLAVVLSEAAQRRQLAQENTFGGDLRVMMRDLQTRLDTSFALTTNQKVFAFCQRTSGIFLINFQANIRGIAQDTVHEATRTVFATMHVDVLVCVGVSQVDICLFFGLQKALKGKKQLLDLENVFGVPIREKKLNTELKRTCSSVRNAFRQEIRDSIDPATFIQLDKFVYSLATKFKLGGVDGELSDLYTIHAVLLVCWSSHLQAKMTRLTASIRFRSSRAALDRRSRG
ncbi:hypothetical protein B0H12DRAFT_1150298 [Mycena haematopus]|nr:hypothetical protein B0H12DRAFT_1150298 [Mycena haematopus]